MPRAAWAIVAAAVPVHLGLALATDLSPDEAYYLCAARLGGRIVDHPPLVMWLLRLSDRWTAAPVELRVRIWAMAASLATGLAVVALAHRRGAGREGILLAAWLGTWALLPMAGGFVTTPDAPFLLAVTLALLAASRAPAAVALLVGALAKVTALPVVAALALGDRGRSPVARALSALVPWLALPFLLPSLRFQLRHAFIQTAPLGWSAGAAVGALVAAVTAQAFLWSPAMLGWGFRGLRALPSPDRALWWSLTGLVLLSALVRGVPPEPNWWAPAAIVMLVAFSRAAEDLSLRARRVILAAVLLPTAIAAAHTARPFLPLPERADPTARLHGWSTGPEPLAAPGLGPYSAAAERCVYRGTCNEISSYFNQLHVHE
ncbi:Hypothetical protein A7982_03000 [Minicystis rosea]|nr:Hypothetical protein A7982_03000 [Minicystis rosea]